MAANPQAPDVRAAFETVDNAGNVGDYATLEFNSEGQPYIAYQNASLGQLKVATKENGNWRSSMWTKAPVQMLENMPT